VKGFDKFDSEKIFKKMTHGAGTPGSRPVEPSERQSHKRSKNAQFQCEGCRPMKPVGSEKKNPYQIRQLSSEA